MWPDRLQLPLRFDPDRLQHDLAQVQGGDWIRHFVAQNYDGDWSVIPLRGPAGATHPVQMIYPDPTASAFADAPALAATPYLREALGAFACPLQCVRLMRLTPGSRIKPHQDHDLTAENGVARIHAPITTNPDVDFRLNGERIDMAPGEAWYLRLADTHSVENRGTTDRVHLVIDVEVNDWLAGLLDAAAAA
jgi:aspartyl/asparaginyl beta-hydroxylase